MTTYTPLHPVAPGDHDGTGDDNTPTAGPATHQHSEFDEGEAEDGDDDDDLDIHHHKHAFKKEVLESFDFNDTESMMWRKVLQ